LALSVQTEIFPIGGEQLAALLDFIEAMMSGGKIDHRKIDDRGLRRRLEEAVHAVGGRAFVRTGSRSPKDNPIIMGMDLRPIPVYCGWQAMEAVGYSERVYLDLGDARRAGYRPHLCVRRFIDIDPDKEFRCFIEDGVIVGITQYYLEDVDAGWIKRHAALIERTLHDYLDALIIPLAGMPSLTCDIALDREFRPTLIEINPPVSGGNTYPGLFGGCEFDGSFKFCSTPAL
jgi:hypothetical protein